MNHGDRRNELAKRLLSGIFNGDYPSGMRMRVEHLAREHEVSATPIREALVELANFGVVELQPNRGAVVKPFGARQVQEICQLRRLLECEAARCCCGNISPEKLEAMETALQSLVDAKRNRSWSRRTRDLDNQLHQLISTYCGNDRLAEEINRYSTIFRALRDARHEKRLAIENYIAMEENSEHIAIIQAIRQGNPDRASQAMADHVSQSAQAIIEDMFPPKAVGELVIEEANEIHQ